jgi:hypothetical protein
MLVLFLASSPKAIVDTNLGAALHKEFRLAVSFCFEELAIRVENEHPIHENHFDSLGSLPNVSYNSDSGYSVCLVEIARLVPGHCGAPAYSVFALATQSLNT